MNKDDILDIFFSTKGGLDAINAAIENKLQKDRTRKISVFEKYIKARISANPKSLKMANFEIVPLEAIYLSRHPSISEVEVLDLRKNTIGDLGMEAIAESKFLTNLRKLDLRNNLITRVGMEYLAKSTTLKNLEEIDLRVNKLGSRWEEKLKSSGDFPNLQKIKTL
jgi:Ran GTPase-activating protein (RanGAP) involved in mRNA processing and transport